MAFDCDGQVVPAVTDDVLANQDRLFDYLEEVLDNRREILSSLKKILQK